MHPFEDIVAHGSSNEEFVFLKKYPSANRVFVSYFVAVDSDKRGKVRRAFSLCLVPRRPVVDHLIVNVFAFSSH